MITHYILMSSSYSEGTRIALDYTIKEEQDYFKLKDIVPYIVGVCGKDVSLSTHCIQTESEDWQDVIKKDSFFRDVKVIKNKEEFVALIEQDRELCGLDVAKYILSKVKCTHLKLEKLVYLCFAEYLCEYDKELYKDKIFAYKYGPVVKSVYEKYKGYGYKEIEKENIDATDIYEMPSRSRILFARDGVLKIKSIDDTLDKYGILSTTELVDLTHKKNTPWYLSGQGSFINKIIKNDIIKKYHCNECI